jgi:ribosome maturation factor RimP
MNEQQNRTEQLIDLINPLVSPLGYEVVYLEVLNHRQKTLRVFIDFKDPVEDKAIGIEDCVHVTRALDEPLDQLPEIEAIFKGAYELEVSSPGVDRPLRTPRDFERFKGREVRIHVFRPLSAEELTNADYQTKNPKQKNFLGTLKGFQESRVLLEISPQGSTQALSKSAQKKARKKSNDANGTSKEASLLSTKSVDEVSIPFPLIAKANLEPDFEIGPETDERE